MSGWGDSRGGFELELRWRVRNRNRTVEVASVDCLRDPPNQLHVLLRHARSVSRDAECKRGRLSATALLPLPGGHPAFARCGQSASLIRCRCPPPSAGVIRAPPFVPHEVLRWVRIPSAASHHVDSAPTDNRPQHDPVVPRLPPRGDVPRHLSVIGARLVLDVVGLGVCRPTLFVHDPHAPGFPVRLGWVDVDRVDDPVSPAAVEDGAPALRTVGNRQVVAHGASLTRSFETCDQRPPGVIGRGVLRSPVAQ
jgi:hypothetical protein